MPTEQKYKDIYGAGYNSPEMAGMVAEGGDLPASTVTKELAMLVNTGKLKIHDVWSRLTDDERDSFTGDMARIKEEKVANPSETNKLALKATAAGLTGAALGPMLGAASLPGMVANASRSVGGAIAGGEGIRWGGKALGLPPWLANAAGDLFMATGGVRAGKGATKGGEATPKEVSPSAGATGTSWMPGDMPLPTPKPPTRASSGPPNGGSRFTLSPNEETSIRVLEDNMTARGIKPDDPLPPDMANGVAPKGPAPVAPKPINRASRSKAARGKENGYSANDEIVAKAGRDERLTGSEVHERVLKERAARRGPNYDKKKADAAKPKPVSAKGKSK